MLQHVPRCLHSSGPVGLIDKASRLLANSLPPAVPTSYRALADYSEVPCSTLYARA
ncbi:hypothetical protein BDW02DRAFT_617963 [Decorospora gaudefroyi]|uniref:Uncharacterized protein n=1 Tax=Decorospora gaudefroyi TaxID=184978 RepID=A0A6A5KCR1_9PLEO|nr:hypothetical protein BDW02DRAFT_617963 [Decorospora gaudefroyi]